MKFSVRDLCWLLLVAALAAYCIKLTRDNRLLTMEVLEQISQRLTESEERGPGIVDRYELLPPESVGIAEGN